MEYGVQTSLIWEKTDFDSRYSCSPVHTFISHVGEQRVYRPTWMVAWKLKNTHWLTPVTQWVSVISNMINYLIVYCSHWYYQYSEPVDKIYGLRIDITNSLFLAANKGWIIIFNYTRWVSHRDICYAHIVQYIIVRIDTIRNRL